MTNEQIGLALFTLRPGSEYVMDGDNYANLVWLDADNDAPTLKQITDTIVSLPTIKATQQAQADTAKAAAQAKLAALGLTTDDLKALGL